MFHRAVIDGSARTQKDTFILKGSPLTIDELAETKAMLVRLGRRITMVVGKLESAYGTTEALVHEAQDEPWVQITLSKLFRKMLRKGSGLSKSERRCAGFFLAATVLHELAHAVHMILALERGEDVRSAEHAPEPCLYFPEMPDSQHFSEVGYALECLAFGGTLDLQGDGDGEKIRCLRYGMQITNHISTDSDFPVDPRKWETIWAVPFSWVNKFFRLEFYNTQCRATPDTATKCPKIFGFRQKNLEWEKLDLEYEAAGKPDL